MAELALKQALKGWGIRQAALASGIGLSVATVNLIANRGHYPKTLDAGELQRKIERWLAGRLGQDGIRPGADELKALWDAAATAPQGIETAGGEPPGPLEQRDTMLTHANWLTHQTKRHFGLPRDPFRDDVEAPEDVFLSGEHGLAYAALEDALNGHRMVAVIGESGSGKTTIRSLFEERYGDANRYALIVPYMLGADDQGRDAKPLRGADVKDSIISTLDPDGRVPQSRQAKDKRVHLLLKRSHDAGRKACLVIDQAHKLPVRTLVFLKELHDLKAGMRRLCGVALIAQPELEHKLNISTSWEAREFIQRLEKYRLSSLDAGGQLEEYLALKLARVGKRIEDVFEKDACDALRELLQVRGRPGRGGKPGELRSWLFPLAIHNHLAKAMILCADIGRPKVGGEQIRAALGV